VLLPLEALRRNLNLPDLLPVTMAFQLVSLPLEALSVDTIVQKALWTCAQNGQPRIGVKLDTVRGILELTPLPAQRQNHVGKRRGTLYIFSKIEQKSYFL